MDSIFLLEEGDRSAFLKQMMQSFGCVYICLWSYLPPPSNCLLALDGLYREQGNQPSRLFHVYRESVIYVDNGRIPGLAFKNNIPYMELKLHDFQRLVSSEVQLQFYQEAGIKMVVFMGCATGEIELGLLNDPQIDLEREMTNLFPINVSQHVAGPPSSSSSSLRSLSVEGPEYPPLLFNIPSTSFIPEPSSIPETSKEALLEDALRSAPVSIPTAQDQAKPALSQIQNIQFPRTESEDTAMTKAILAVLTSPSTSSSSSQFNIRPSAFRRYRAMAPLTPPTAIPAKQNKFKRAVLFFRDMNWRRNLELQVQGNRPTANQLHHMISERRRREKLNESFQVLRSLLPPGSKKDKASVLSNTTEYLSSLKTQVEELSKRNQMLELQLSTRKSKAGVDQMGSSSSTSVERVNVEITQVSSSTSEGRFLDLRVSVRGESSLLDLVIRLMEFLKQLQNLTLLSIDSNTRMLETIPVHGVMLRLKIEGDEFDKSGFEEGVRRVVDDQAH